LNAEKDFAFFDGTPPKGAPSAPVKQEKKLKGGRSRVLAVEAIE
jgi:hypothetical protein